MGRDDEPMRQAAAESGELVVDVGRDSAQNFPSRVSKWVGLSSVGISPRTHSAVHSTSVSTGTRGSPYSAWQRLASLSRATSDSVPTNRAARPRRSRETERRVAHRYRLRPGDIQNVRRVVAELEGADENGVRVALPDRVHLRHRDVDRLAAVDLLGDVEQDAVPKVRGVVQPHEQDARAVLRRHVLEHPLPPEAGLRVLADGSRRSRLVGSCARDRHEGIHVAGREGDDPRCPKALRDDRRQVAVERPRKPRRAARAELHPGEVDHVGRVGEALPARCVRGDPL